MTGAESSVSAREDSLAENLVNKLQRVQLTNIEKRLSELESEIDRLKSKECKCQIDLEERKKKKTECANRGICLIKR